MPGVVTASIFATASSRSGTLPQIDRSRALRSAREDGLSRPINIPAFNSVAIPNPELKPEHSRGNEIGVRSANEFSSFELALFDNHYRDLIESRANLGRDPVSGALVFQSINRDRAHIYGALEERKSE